SQLKAWVLDIAVRQVSEHTNLKTDYQLLKKGRAYDAVRFTIASQQPQQLPIPFEQPVEDVRAYSARQHLEALGITQLQLVATILGDAQHLDQLFKFAYQLITDKVKATKNSGGLFLKICGLR
ncbi:MAG TPA: replication initiation protein, partial [Hymenobacter sp.]